MTKTHSGTCEAHQQGPKLCDRIRMMGYYWPTMIKDKHELADVRIVNFMRTTYTGP